MFNFFVEKQTTGVECRVMESIKVYYIRLHKGWANNLIQVKEKQTTGVECRVMESIKVYYIRLHKGWANNLIQVKEKHKKK